MRFLAFLLLVVAAHATVYNSDGSQSDVQAKINGASNGDTITVPSGTFTWGASATYVDVNKAVTLIGAGSGSTTIAASTTAGTFGAGVLRITASNATVRDFSMTTPSNGSPITLMAMTGAITGVRITGVIFNGPTTTPGYQLYFAGGASGVIWNCTFNGNNGSQEMIWGNGPTTAWTTAVSALWGTANMPIVEDCTFTGAGYVCDIGINGLFTVRKSTMTGQNKVDGHGLASNPPRGVRLLECYQNTWTALTGFDSTIEMRGGTGVMFGNAIANNEAVWTFFTDYGYQAQYEGFDYVFQTPNNYPIGDQIGAGPSTIINATALTAYRNAIIVTAGTTNFTLIGAANNNVGTRFIATGAGTGTGTVYVEPAATEPFYVWSNTHNGSQISRTLKAPAAGAITLYGSTFTERTLIAPNRDVFSDAGYDTATGVSVGTAAAMAAYTPSVTGYGWWVTDEGSWNTLLPSNTSGRLYRWSGSAWVLHYTPYTYPHPLRGGSTESGNPRQSGLLLGAP